MFLVCSTSRYNGYYFRTVKSGPLAGQEELAAFFRALDLRARCGRYLGGKTASRSITPGVMHRLCVSALHSQEKQSSELYICIVSWGEGDGEMGRDKKEKDRKKRGMEKGNSACQERDLKKRNPVITSPPI